MRKAKLFSSLLRISLGWVFLYQGIVAFRTAGFTVLPFIKNAGTFSYFYNWVGQASNIGTISLVVKILFILVGALLVLNAWAKIVSLVGIALMLFFYFPLLHFPYVGETYYIINEHIIFALILAYFFVTKPNDGLSLGNMFSFSRY